MHRAFQGARACFHSALVRMSSERGVIEQDIARWVEVMTGTREMDGVPRNALVWLVARHPEFRNLFYYRIAKERRLAIRALLGLARLCYRPMESLYILTETIGPGLFIQHGFSTVIAAKSMGRNCWVNQQVTIGFSNVADCPVIGDSVAIKAGAIVIGDITIGDNSRIGAGTVVVKNVPANCTVVGGPAYIVKREGRDTREVLK